MTTSPSKAPALLVEEPSPPETSSRSSVKHSRSRSPSKKKQDVSEPVDRALHSHGPVPDPPTSPPRPASRKRVVVPADKEASRDASSLESSLSPLSLSSRDHTPISDKNIDQANAAVDPIVIEESEKDEDDGHVRRALSLPPPTFQAVVPRLPKGLVYEVEGPMVEEVARHAEAIDDSVLEIDARSANTAPPPSVSSSTC